MSKLAHKVTTTKHASLLGNRSRCTLTIDNVLQSQHSMTFSGYSNLSNKDHIIIMFISHFLVFNVLSLADKPFVVLFFLTGILIPNFALKSNCSSNIKQ